MCDGKASVTDSRGGTGGQFPPPAALETALWLLGRGLWPIPISPADDRRSPGPGKAPIGRGWGRRRPTGRSLRAAYRRHPRAGVGIALGPAGGVVDLEVDDPGRAEAALTRLFPEGLPDTLGWRSPRGEHRLFAWDDRLRGLAVPSVVPLAGGAIELRVGGPGKQVASVCPPSPAAEGGRRTWNGVWHVAPLPDVLVAELGRIAGPPAHRRPFRLPGGGRMDRYAAAALGREAERVRVAGPGDRNRTLNRAAFSLGQLVADGVLPRGEVEAALAAAAGECGLDTREAAGTIRSGLEAGLGHPRGRAGPGISR